MEKIKTTTLCPLAAAYCLLLAAFCPLPTACCPLPTCPEPVEGLVAGFQPPLAVRLFSYYIYFQSIANWEAYHADFRI
jgi:hypothetical protein